MDANAVFDRAYDKTNRQLSLLPVDGTAATSPSGLSANLVWSRVFDVATGTIRTIRVA